MIQSADGLVGKRVGRVEQVTRQILRTGDDAIGIAFGQAIPSDDYEEANEDAGTSLKADSESHLELYYSFKVNDHLTLTPDLQVIWDPYGGDGSAGDDTIVVGGVRGQVDF